MRGKMSDKETVERYAQFYLKSLKDEVQFTRSIL
jgi:hypothetical protein